MENWPYIFESPDGGETVYIRKPGENERTLFHVSDKALGRISELKETQLWYEIRKAAKDDETLQKAIDHVKLLYLLKKNHGSETGY